jgi:hypothetical protein
MYSVKIITQFVSRAWKSAPISKRSLKKDKLGTSTSPLKQKVSVSHLISGTFVNIIRHVVSNLRGPDGQEKEPYHQRFCNDVFVAPQPISKTFTDKSITGSGHQSPGLWRHPEDESWKFKDTEHWIELAKLLEDAKFHGIFIADVLGGYDVYKKSLEPAIISGAQWPLTEPLAVIPAMAAATKSIGFGATVSVTYEQPYHLARRLSTVDHLTKGRLVFKNR